MKLILSLSLSLSLSLGSQPSELEDQEDDAEYNFWAEQLKDDKEEFRTDRGVKIPRK